MPIIDSDGSPIYAEVAGRDDAPALLLSNSLGTTLEMWDEQVTPFTKHFRIIRYDHRGHGKSGISKSPYTMERLSRDALAVLDGLGIKSKVNFCGLSMGGMIGQWLAANVPDRIERIVLSNTTALPDKNGWSERLKVVEQKGVAAVAGHTMSRWFTKGFAERSPETVARIQAMFAATPLEGYLGSGAAIRDMDQRALLPAIKSPTLVISGAEDGATPPAAGKFIAEAIPGAKFMQLEAAHLSSVEQSEAYTKAVLDFLLAK